MEFNEIKELIELFSRSDVGELELEREGLSLKLAKSSVPAIATQIVETERAPAIPSPEPVRAVEPPSDLIWVTSPIVGTFYRAPNPKAAPFVEVGDRVHKGQTLCIVEAMKLMNEIQAEESGIVSEISVENGDGVQFNQKLIALKKG